MGITIALILAVITLIYNGIKKYRIGVNIFVILIPVVLSGITIAFAAQSSSFYIINTIYTALALILAILSILYVVKEVKTIRGAKSVPLIGIILTYICINMLANPNSFMALTISDELNRVMILSLSITLLVIFQVNLFINLISNTTNLKNKSDSKTKEEEKA